MNGHQEQPSITPLTGEKLENQIRFETELEFVQCLANPHYLNSLAQQGLLAQPNFIAYLKYLTYWMDVEKGYSRFIVYPHALHHLALLQEPTFREALKNPEVWMHLDKEQYLHWRTWRTNEQTTIPTHGHIHPSSEEIDAPTPTRTTRRSGTARSSGARTPAGRTPRSVRTPGFGAGARTPAPKSTLSASMTASNHLDEVGPSSAAPSSAVLPPPVGNMVPSSGGTMEGNDAMVLDTALDVQDRSAILRDGGAASLEGNAAGATHSDTTLASAPKTL